MCIDYRCINYMCIDIVCTDFPEWIYWVLFLAYIKMNWDSSNLLYFHVTDFSNRTFVTFNKIPTSFASVLFPRFHCQSCWPDNHRRFWLGRAEGVKWFCITGYLLQSGFDSSWYTCALVCKNLSQDQATLIVESHLHIPADVWILINITRKQLRYWHVYNKINVVIIWFLHSHTLICSWEYTALLVWNQKGSFISGFTSGHCYSLLLLIKADNHVWRLQGCERPMSNNCPVQAVASIQNINSSESDKIYRNGYLHVPLLSHEKNNPTHQV